MNFTIGHCCFSQSRIQRRSNDKTLSVLWQIDKCIKQRVFTNELACRKVQKAQVANIVR